MITELHIENLGVIERLELMLGAGLTAVTGETGAGKTMIVEALELVVGGRADASMVRHGADEARVDVRIVRADGTESVLTRVVPADGRSRAYVDGRLATATTLAEVADGEIDLHGQHAHQRLLSGPTQRAALDEFGGIDLEPLRRARGRLAELDAAIAALGGDPRARARELDLLRFQVGELDAAAVVDSAEDDVLDAEESVLADATAHREAAAVVVEAVSGEGGVRDTLAAALAALAGRDLFASLAGRLHDVLAELDDIAAELRDAGERVEESPERLAEIRARRQLLRELRRKYGEDLAAVIGYHAVAEERLRELESHDERLHELGVEREAALTDERRRATEVGAARRAAAPELAAAVQAQLRQLAMPDAVVAVEVGEHADDHPGDRVQFLLAANPGSPLLPLNRVASGGELARAMLALRLVLSSSLSAERTGDTLVFDEVDAGIGGTAAHSIGAALARIGRRHQVLVVTHLAQVAAAATQHLHVAKTVRDGATFATAAILEEGRRVTELARMLSGSTSESALRHARELLG